MRRSALSRRQQPAPTHARPAARPGGAALQRLSRAAGSSAIVMQLHRLQGAADALPSAVVQRAPSDRPALQSYLEDTGKDLGMTAPDRDEILDVAQEVGDLEEGKAWLADWVDGMRKLPRALDRAFEHLDLFGQLRDDLEREGIAESNLLDIERDALIQQLKLQRDAQAQLDKSTISSRQTEVQTRARNRAQRAYAVKLREAKERIAHAAEQERQRQAALDLQSAFAQDKTVLSDWVSDNTSGGTAAVLRAVLNAHTLGSGANATVDRMYPAADIMLAHNAWWRLYQETETKMQVFGLFQNPGNRERLIYWKDRGAQWECTRNFIANVNKHTSNVHVSPHGGSPKPKRRYPTEPDPIG